MKHASLIEIWSEQIVTVLEFMAGDKVTATWMVDANAGKSNPSDTWIEQGFTSGAAWLCLPSHSWKGIGQLLLETVGVTGEDAALLQSSWLEVVAQVGSGVANALTAASQSEVAPKRPAIDTSPRGGAASHYVLTVRAGGGEFPVVLAFNKELHRVLDQLTAPPPAAQAPEAKVDKASEIDLLLDVEVPVSVSFGQTYLPLREVLRLTTGSLIELDRLISDPVDIVVNNCVIAKGEVVIVEGSYGVRILEVISRSERLALRKTGKPLPVYQEFRLKTGA